MDATTMAKTDLVNRLSADFPQFKLESGQDFYWSPDKQTIFFRPLKTHADAKVLLHEMSHALLGHHNFSRDIELLKMEREAWTYAQRELGEQYDVPIDDEDIEDSLEGYRGWLHDRSRCPHCTLTGIQATGNQYRCLGCSLEWSVNDARRKRLIRTTIS